MAIAYKDNITKYLHTYSEWETNLARAFPVNFWHRAVVVPVYAEDEAMLKPLLDSLEKSSKQHELRTLTIIVLNAKENSSELILDLNATVSKFLTSYPNQKITDIPPTHLIKWSNHLDLYLIDRSRGKFLFPSTWGVGHARKIGCDLAVALWHRGLIASPIIRTTDADARVSPNYLLYPEAGENLYTFGYYQYRHENLEFHPELELYEMYLRYYYQGLRSANSPYAFHALGSTLFFSVYAYATVRGFPKRQAGEDFYFLNKLVKLSPAPQTKIEHPSIVHLAARTSDRVPFGTGRAMQEIAEILLDEEEYLVFHPETFSILKNLLTVSKHFLNNLDETQLLAHLSILPSFVKEVLERQKILQSLWSYVACSSDLETRERQWLQWFDGLKTLQFLKGISFDEFTPVPLDEALRTSRFLPKRDGMDDEMDLERLRNLEGLFT